MTRKKITHERRHIGLRVEILDELLSSTKRRNYNDLLNTLNNKLKGIDEIPISERTLKYDIAFLENEKDAPIHRPTKSDPGEDRGSARRYGIHRSEVATLCPIRHRDGRPDSANSVQPSLYLIGMAFHFIAPHHTGTGAVNFYADHQ